MMAAVTKAADSCAGLAASIVGWLASGGRLA